MHKSTLKILAGCILCVTSTFLYAQNIDNNQANQALPKINNSQHLALACLACHSSPNLPNLHIIPKALLEQKLQDYAKDIRQGTIMHKLLKGYSDTQLQEIANYFSEEK